MIGFRIELTKMKPLDSDGIKSFTSYFKTKRVGMKRIINGFLVTFVLVYVIFIFILFSQSSGTESTGLTTQSLFTPSFLLKKDYPLFYGHECLLNYPEAFRPRSVKLTPLDYNFTINSPPVCPSTSNNPTLFILILTQHDAYNQRKAIRDTWGRIARHEPWPGRRLLGEVRLIFLLGAIKNVTLNKAVQVEASENRDIVEANFVDSYFNLTLKVLMGIKWVRTHCSNTKYIMKMDEDSFLDIPRLVNMLNSVSLRNAIIGPYSYSEKVTRPNPHGNSSKGSVSFEAYSPAWYPPHVKGNFYVMPYSLAVKILNVSEYFPYVNIEDAYITGILAKVFDTRHIEITVDQYDKYPEMDLDYCAFVLERRIACQKVYPELLYNFWKRIENTELCGVIRVDKVIKEYLVNVDQHIKNNITKENKTVSRDKPKVQIVNQNFPRHNQNVPRDNQNVQRDNQNALRGNQNVLRYNQNALRVNQNVLRYKQNIQRDNQNNQRDNQNNQRDNQNVQRDNQNVPKDNQNVPKDNQNVPKDNQNVLRYNQNIPRFN